MQVIFLGTNGWYDTDTGNTICILLKTDKYYIILDAGNGIHRINDYCRTKKPSFLFISHFHLDHISGLHILNKIRCFKTLHIIGPAGSKSILTKFINSPFTMPILQLPYPVQIHEFPEEQDLLPFSAAAKPLLHSSLTLGYRIELNHKIISYCPDTGYCENAVTLSRDADLLIAECAYKSRQNSPEWPHLNPETAAKIANEAHAKRLALVHFDAHLYKTLDQRRKAEVVAQKIYKNAFAAMDKMQISV
jgi:ribonuclease BN (tRNA processing enzyme)